MGGYARLRARIAALVLLGALVVAGGVALLLDNTVGLRESSNSAVSADDYLLRAGNLERLVVDVETGLRGYAITGRALFLQPLFGALARLPAAEAALASAAAAEHAYQAQSGALVAAVQRYLSGYVTPLVTTAGHDLAKARSLTTTLEGKRLVDGIRQQTATLEGLVSARQATRQRAAHRSANRSIVEAIVVLVLLTLFTVLLGAILGRLIVERERSRESSEAENRTLQESILPPALPQVPGVELASRFVPAAGLVGGDFYDAFAVAPQRWAVIIGDVSGKGPDAAALTAMARWTLRSSLESAAAPAEALRLLNRAMLRRELPQFVTAVCMALELDAGGAEVSVACAGHPAPVFVPRDGDPSAVNSVGTLLGLVAEVDLPTASVRLAPGASLVAYTDGVTDQGPEVRDPVEQAIAARPPGATAEQLADMLLGFAQGPAQRRRDDIAILALRFIGDGA